MTRTRNMDHDNAISMMQHYFRTAFEAAGIAWSGDNDEEIERLCDALIDAAARKDDT